MSTFDGFFVDVIEDTENALSDYTANNTFTSVVVGAVQIDKLDYPCVHIIPDTCTYQTRQEYEFIITVNYYFKRDIRDYSFVKNLKTVEPSIDDIIKEYGDNDEVTEFKVNNVEYMTGEIGQIMLDIYRITFQVSKLFDYAKI